jgi:Zn finger protein HypA/HybF involved in hydrogenase expression
MHEFPVRQDLISQIGDIARPPDARVRQVRIGIGGTVEPQLQECLSASLSQRGSRGLTA